MNSTRVLDELQEYSFDAVRMQEVWLDALTCRRSGFKIFVTPKPRKEPAPDLQEVKRALKVFLDDEHFVFVQSLPNATSTCLPGADNGGIAEWIDNHSDGAGMYFGINPVSDIRERITESAGKKLSTNDDVVRRRWLLIDIDRNKKAEPNDPATNQERTNALALTDKIRTYLSEIGFPEPIQVDSGNGFHLYYKVDMPNDAEHRDLVHAFLDLLNNSFPNGGDVDTSVFDARRISRMPGTWNRKGNASEHRPYRQCKFIEVPKEVQLLPVELLRRVVEDDKAYRPDAEMPDAATSPATSASPAESSTDDRPGAVYNREGDWDELLTGAGYTHSRTAADGVKHYARPGKDDGTSVTVGYCKSGTGEDKLYCFTTNGQPFVNGKSYSKFRAYALLHHDGDDKKAAAELGKKSEPRLVFGKGPKGEDADGSNDTKSNEATLPVPIPLTRMPDVPTFPVDVFPAEIKRIVEEGSAALNVPTCFFGMTALALAGCAIGNSRHISLNQSYSEGPLLYSVIVAPPGKLKTPTLKVLRRPFDVIQLDEAAKWKLACAAWEKNEKEDRGPKPTQKRVVVSNITVESLMVVLRENPRGVAMICDELASLINSFNQYKQGKGADKQFYLENWSQSPIYNDRKSDHASGTTVIHLPFVGIVGGTQPDVLESIAAGSKGGYVNDGFIDRFAPAWPDELPFVGEQGFVISEDAKSAWESCIRKLHSLEMKNSKGPHYARLDQIGLDEWKRFTNNLASEMNHKTFPPHLIGPWSKLKGMAARIALILSMMRWSVGNGSDMVIDGLAVRDAVKVIYYLKDNVRRVHECLGSDPRTGGAKRILKWITSKQIESFDRRDAHRQFQKVFKNSDERDGALALLEKHFIILPIEPKARNGKPGRGPSPGWTVNPLVHAQDAEMTDGDDDE